MSFSQDFSNAIKQIILNLENEKIPFINYVLGFFFIIVIRQFIESYSQYSNYFNTTSPRLAIGTIHFCLSYTMVAFFLILLFHFATNDSINKVGRIVLPGFIVLWINPLTDLLFSFKTGVAILYIQPGHLTKNLLYTYLTFFGDFKGASFGLKTEIVIALIGIFFYLRSKNLSILSSLFYVWAAYSIIFLFGASPLFIKAILDLFGLPYEYSGILMVHFYLLINLVLVTLVLYLADSMLFKALFKSIPLLRIFHYELSLLLGVSLGLVGSSYDIWPQFTLFSDRIINIILAMISLFFACLFAIVENNIADIRIDKISNPNRPLIKKQIDIPNYRFFGWIAFALSLFYASMVSVQALIIMSFFMGTYFLYSVLPFRLKRIPILSKLAISTNSIALIILGYILVRQWIYGFPNILFVIYLAGFTLAANFIDLKDIEGDEAEGIMTMPVVLGEKFAKIIIGIAFWLTSISFYFLIPYYSFLILTILVGGIQFYLINRQPYREYLVLGFYNIEILILIVILLTMKIFS